MTDPTKPLPRQRRAFDSAADDIPGAETDNLAKVPCRQTSCGKLTLRTTLAHYGGRCFECYERFCAAPQPKVDVGDKRIDPKSWAHALRRREKAGERLTPPQRAMWRAALHLPAEAQP